MKRNTVESGKIVRATARTVITSGLIFVAALYLLAFFISKNAHDSSISLENENAVYTIERTDGSVETYYQNHFPLVHNGETLTCEIAPLREHAAGFQNGTLVFSLYHCYISVYCGDTLIYQQTEPGSGQMIGHRYYIVPLPEGYEDKTITIVAVDAENDTFSTLIEPKIIPADCTTYAFHGKSFATGILLISLLIATLFMEIYSLINRIVTRKKDGLFSISLLSTCVCLWYMGFSGDMQPFVENATFLAVAEYIGIYLSPAALAFFLYCHCARRKLRIFCLAVTIYLLAYFVFASWQTLFVPGISYVDFIGWLRLMFLFVLFILLFAEIGERKVVKDLGEQTLHRGMAVTIILGIIELVRFLLAERISDRVVWISNSIMPFVIVALCMTAFMYYGVRVTENQYHNIEEENLKKLAYLDQLTGAPNRAACYERMDRMRKDHVTDYVVAFIDIDFLKKTNDTWGHDKGDELIRTASDLLKKHFAGRDFFGRWGGDEFIAIHFGTLEETKEIMAAIQQDIDAVNTFGRHDFHLSESWGFGESTRENPLDPDEAIRQADAKMYLAKQRSHAGRQ